MRAAAVGTAPRRRKRRLDAVNGPQMGAKWAGKGRIKRSHGTAPQPIRGFSPLLLNGWGVGGGGRMGRLDAVQSRSCVGGSGFGLKSPHPPPPARARPPVPLHEYCPARAFSWRSFSRRKSPTDFDFRPFPAKKASRRRAAPPDRDNGVETAPLDAVTLPGLTPFKTARQLALPPALWRVTSRPQGTQGGRKGTWRPIHMTLYL